MACLCQHGATAAQLQQLLRQPSLQSRDPDAAIKVLIDVAGLSSAEAVAAAVRQPWALSRSPNVLTHVLHLLQHSAKLTRSPKLYAGVLMPPATLLRWCEQ